jgi:putative salt-induced outer membrane protein YdiY
LCRMKFFKSLIFMCCFLWATSAWSIEIYLKNGDKISGTVTGDNGTFMMVQTLAAGEIKIDKAFIDLPKTYPEKYAPPHILAAPQPPPPPKVEWKKTFSVGYTQNGGNTKNQLGQLDAFINRKTDTDELTFKYDALYSSSSDVINGRKFYGMLRYANSFGSNLKWYNFYKMEGDQDRSADIYYRLDPSIGRGYWFSTTDDLKAMAELGIGYQYTHFYSNTKPTGSPVLVPRFFIDKRLFGKLHLSEDFTFYPSLDNLNDYRFRSETDLTNQISARWALKISYIDSFNSVPPLSVKKNDYTFVTSLQYTF